MTFMLFKGDVKNWVAAIKINFLMGFIIHFSMKWAFLKAGPIPSFVPTIAVRAGMLQGAVKLGDRAGPRFKTTYKLVISQNGSPQTMEWYFTRL